MASYLPPIDWVAYLENFSTDYLDAARLFAENAQKMEQEHGTPEDLSKVDNLATPVHFSYVAGSIFMVNACLSAAIDEVFRDANRLNRDSTAQTSLKQLSPNVVKDMADARNAKVVELSNYPDLDKVLKNTKPSPCKKDPNVTCLPFYENWYLLDKFQLALYLADLSKEGKPFDLGDDGDDVWKEAEFLRGLRNYLVHYEPEWIKYTFSNGSYDAKKRTTDVMVGLRDRGFRNKLYPKDAEWHEGRMKVRLGADCAEWAVKSSSDFLYEFYKRMPIDELKDLLYHRRLPL